MVPPVYVRVSEPVRPSAQANSPGYGDGPRTSKGCGARSHSARVRRGYRVSTVAQTAAGSSSTRRLRVRLASSGMPGPIVVASAAFLM